VTDAAGNQTASTVLSSRRVDNTAPSATMGNPGANVRGTVTLTSTTNDAGSGIASTEYQYSAAGAASWQPTAANWDTTALADALYDLRVVVTDAAGNQTQSTPVANVRVDNTAPSATMGNPGAYVRATVSLTSTTSDAGSGITSTQYQYSAAGAN